MMVELDNGMRFITNFRYNLKDGLSVNDKDQLKQISSGTDEFFSSDCKSTMIGSVMLTQAS
jgi:hypothetical protein